MSDEQRRIKRFRDLEVWKLGMDIVKSVYEFTTALPREEQFGLTAQMRRAAISLPSNVAEGFRRRNDKEFRQFLHISLGSAAELETQIEICLQIHGLDRNTANILSQSLDQFQAMSMGLIKRLRT